METEIKEGTLVHKAFVLVAVGNPDEMYVISGKLKEAGYRVLGFIDCDEARDFMTRDLPDLVVVDLQLPAGSGYDLMGKVRSDERTRDVPLIALSSGEVDTAAVDVEANVLLKRPVDAATLLSAVKRVLKK